MTGLGEYPENTSGLEQGSQLDIRRIRSELFDPRVISRRRDVAGGRNNAALDVRVSRQESRLRRSAIAEREAGLDRIEEQIATLTELRSGKLADLQKRIGELLVRVKSTLGIEDKLAANLQQEAVSLKKETDRLSREAEEIREDLVRLRREQEEIPGSRELLTAYYESMEVVPLTNAEKREMLKPEILAELSTEEYISLWRRLNPHFLSHVTRQGFRDHNAMIYHSGGLQDFHSGLTSVLEDQKALRPPIAVRDGLRARDKESVRMFLEDWVLQAESEEEARERLRSHLNDSLATAPKYPDKTANHFAAQIVADRYYGGETDNETFFVYPADVIASQHDFAFNGSEKDLTRPQSEAKWNDVFVWPSNLDDPGISVDAGIVFLPEKTLVDPETGSKYASELRVVNGREARVMIEDEALISAFTKWAEDLNEDSPVIRAYKLYRDREHDRWMSREARERECFDVFRSEIMRLGFSEEAAVSITSKLFSSSDGIYEFEHTGMLGFGESKKDAALKQLRSAAANWKRAEGAITAREYWEGYFTAHPEQKPKHIVFYEGSPTVAVYEFQQRHDIGRADVSEAEGALLGFGDRHIDDLGADPRANAGYDELVKIAYGIIQEHYKNNIT